MRRRKTKADEIDILGGKGVIYRRGEYWQFRMWLTGEEKYARKSLQTTHKDTAILRGDEFCLELLSNLKQGKTYFSITVKEGVDRYLAHRQKDVDSGLVVKGRHTTIAHHLKNFLNFIGRGTKLSSLDNGSCNGYFTHRKAKNHNGVRQSTLLNEASTINSAIRFLYEVEKVSTFTHFIFPKLPKIDKKDDKVRRQTFTAEEYKCLYQTARKYAYGKDEAVDPKMLLERQIVRHWIIIGANAGMRFGEQYQLKWGDVEVWKNDDSKDKTTDLIATIRIKAETSKVRTSRTLMCRNGQYFDRLAETVKHRDIDGFVFSVDGKTPISRRKFYSHWNEILRMSEIDEQRKPLLVPYSLRHYMITQRFNNGVSLQQLSQMCGTSIQQIESTYYHLDKSAMFAAATMHTVRNVDGSITPI